MSHIRSPNLNRLTSNFLALSTVFLSHFIHLKSISVQAFLIGSTNKALYRSSSTRTNTLKAAMSSLVVVVGSANVDLNSYSKKFPRPGETVMGERFTTSCGGKGANQAYAAGFGLPGVEVSVICKVGRDQYGEMLVNNFDQRRIKVDKSEIFAGDGCNTGTASIFVEQESGENVIVVVPGANSLLSPTSVEKALQSLDRHPDVILAQLEIQSESVLKAFEIAKEVKPECITILNPAPAPQSLDESFYSLTDILVVNENEAITLAGDDGDEDNVVLATKLLNRGVGRCVIVTLGKDGAIVVEKTQAVTTIANPSLSSDSLPVQDTVGAGDAFCGSLASYLSIGTDLHDSIKKACGIASISVRKLGAQSSYPSYEDLSEELKIVESVKRIKSNPPPITFVTGNKKKLEEVERMLTTAGDLPFTLTNKKLDLPELQGEVDEIAIEKCKLAAKEIGGPVMTEDTSLCFNALDGLPGPYIKWFLEKCGHDGLNGMLSFTNDKSAYAQTIVAFCAGPGCEVKLFDGRTSGNIVLARGPLDFGWDPVFEPDESGGLTYAEMDKDDKNAISHRGRSFEKFKKYLQDEQSSILKQIGV